LNNLLTNLYAYYKMDDASGGATDSSVNHRDMGVSGTLGSALGKINTARVWTGGFSGSYLGFFGDTSAFQPGANPSQQRQRTGMMLGLPGNLFLRTLPGCYTVRAMGTLKLRKNLPFLLRLMEIPVLLYPGCNRRTPTGIFWPLAGMEQI
jgi:hypothetical protein